MQRALAKMNATWKWEHVPDGVSGFPVITDGDAECLQNPEKIVRLQEAVSGRRVTDSSTKHFVADEHVVVESC